MSEKWNDMLTCSSRERSSGDYALLPTAEPAADASERARRQTGSTLNCPSRLASIHPSGPGQTCDQLESQMNFTEGQRTEAQSGGDGQLRQKVNVLERRPSVLPERPESCWRFVETTWFQAMSAVVIITNVLTTIVQMDKPETKHLFFISDQVMLCFYVVELFSRASFYGMLYVLGPCTFVCWNVLDIIVVGGGVMDQWLMPLLPVGNHNAQLSKILRLLRLLRLLRVFKIVRVFLEMDLSWAERPAFQSFIGFVIMINSLLMGMEIDIPWQGWFYFEQVLLCIYVFELSVRLKSFGKFFFSCENSDIVWNVLDFAIVSSSVLDSWITPLCKIVSKSLVGAHEDHRKTQGMSLGKVMMLMRMLRLMRILRLAKLVKSVRPLYILVTGVMAALQGVAWVLVLTIVTLYAMGILATSLIGKKMAFPNDDVPEEVIIPFSTVPNSMFTLFRVMSGAASDKEQVAIDDLMDSCPSIKLGFVFFMITSSWTLLSILTAVVSDNMISTTGQQEEEHKLETAEADRSEHLQGLREIFAAVDSSGDGRAEKRDIEEFLGNRDNAVATAKRCRVPVRDVKEVLSTVCEACEGSSVSLNTFLEYLTDVSSPVTEKSIMKIETRLRNLHRDHDQGVAKLGDILTNLQESAELERSRGLSKLEQASEVCSKALQSNANIMQSLAERTEARLSEIQLKNERLFDKMSQTLELQLDKMRKDLSCKMGSQESDISKAVDGQERGTSDTINAMTGQASSSVSKSSMYFNKMDQALPTATSVTAKSDLERQPIVVKGNGEDVADAKLGVQKDMTTAQMEARLLVAEESIHGLQQQTESILLKSQTLPGVSSVAFDKFSEFLELELRRIRQELLFCLVGRHSQEVSRVRDTTDHEKQPHPVRESSGASSANLEVFAAPMGLQLLEDAGPPVGVPGAPSCLAHTEGT